MQRLVQVLGTQLTPKCANLMQVTVLSWWWPATRGFTAACPKNTYVQMSENRWGKVHKTRSTMQSACIPEASAAGFQIFWCWGKSLSPSPLSAQQYKLSLPSRFHSATKMVVWCHWLFAFCQAKDWRHKTTTTHLTVHTQRREDMTSCRSDNLYALITFQGQQLWMQVTRIALWMKSRRVHGVFY